MAPGGRAAGIRVDGVALEPPYVIDAVGDPDTLSSGVDFQGGFVTDVEDVGGAVRVERAQRIDITSLHAARPLRYATPGARRVRGSSLPRSHRPSPTAQPDPGGRDVFPDDVRYTAEHEWVRGPEGSGDTVRIGITDYAQEQLGDIVYVSLPAVGDQVEEGGAVGELESTKSVSDVFAPLSGEVTAVNDALDANPEMVNAEAYGAGWLFELRPSDPAAVEGLMDAAAYQALVES